jgi:hypothetical protein
MMASTTLSCVVAPMRCVAMPAPERTTPCADAACSSARTTVVPIATMRRPLALARRTSLAVMFGMR